MENVPPDARSKQFLSESSSFHISPIYSPLVPPHACTALSYIRYTREVSKLMYTFGNTVIVCFFPLSPTLKLQDRKVGEWNGFDSFVYLWYTYWRLYYCRLDNRNEEKCKSKVFPFNARKAYYGRGRMAPLILSLGTRCRRVAKLSAQSLYHRERTPIPIEQESR